MHIALLMYGFPDSEGNGAPMASWAIASYLARIGHKITVCSLIEHDNPAWDISRAEELLSAHGIALEPVKVELVDRKIRRGSFLLTLADFLKWLVSPDNERLFFMGEAGPDVQPVLKRVGPDVILYYHLEGLVSTYDYAPHLPRLAVIGDPPNLSFYYRWRNAPFSFSAQYLMFGLRAVHGLYHIPKRLKKMLSHCDYHGELAAHHAEWFRKIGVTDCEYIKMPIRDEAGPGWEEKRKKAKKSDKPRIMMIGDITSASSLAGLILFAREVLPTLENSLGPEGFEVHIIGRGTLPADMVPLLDRPSVKIRGRVEEAAPEFLSSDILFVPTSIPLGVRTRIIVGFSFGCCVVAHAANANGTPEMVHNESALLASDGPGLAREIVRAIKDKDFGRKLGFNGRKVYEKNFHPDKAASLIAEKLLRIGLRV